MTKREVEESCAKLDTWWANLDWAIKEDVRRLVVQIMRPSTAHLPMQYAEDMVLDGETVTTTGRQE